MNNLPEISHLRGLGDPMFFTFNVQPKTNILICHAAIMGTFILPPERKISLCQIDDDPRLPHFVQYLKQNIISNFASTIDDVEKQIEKLKLTKRKIEELTEKARKAKP